ncbi:hypothetical protein GCM10023212_26140 [Luteolibacter yonseiensis]
MFHTRLARLVSLAALIFQPLTAAPVSIGDFSFEGNTLTSGGYSSAIGPEWTGTGGPNNGSSFEEYINGFSSDGTDHLGMVQDYDVWQDLGVTYQVNTRYTLTVGVGNRSGLTSPGNQTQYLLADSTGVVRATGSHSVYGTVPAGTFADAPPLVFDTQANPSAVGKTIRILLRARGEGRSHFDNIRLDASPLFPPGSAVLSTLPATGITAATATLNGEVTSVGNSAPTVTIFWGSSSGANVPADWQHSTTLTGTQSAAFSTQIGGLAANTTYHFIARATNGAGDSWSNEESFETSPLPPTVVTGNATNIGSRGASLGAVITANGGESPAITIYYGTTDGGDTPGDWQASIPPGSIDSSGKGTATGLQVATPYFFRAFAANSGGGSWASNTSTFTTLSITSAQVENAAPTGITGTTATLRGEVTDDGNDPPDITIFYGLTDGGTDPASWTHSAAVGVDGGNFTRFVAGLTTNTTYYFRCRAINGAGTAWADSSDTFATTSLVNSTPVINEIHYHPDDDATLGPIPLEFVELHNPGDSAVDLANWKLADGITFTFPSGTTLNPGGYIVIAQDPATLLAKYGVSALGPYGGKLSNSGETIELRDASNNLKDTVSYQQGFPWPTSADGAGSSMELVNAALDNDVGGSWRSSNSPGTAEVSYISPSSGGWKYKRGTAEASAPVAAWRDFGYNDAAWSSSTAPFGYGGSYTIATNLNAGNAMRNVHRTVYYRKNFTMASNLPTRISLSIRHDDAFVAWINGVEVARSVTAPSGQIPYNYSGSIDGHPATEWETFTFNTVVNGENILRGGTNVLCVHSLNESTGSSDYFFDAGLFKPAVPNDTAPTPGAANSSRITTPLVPPQIRQVAHTPQQPVANVPVTVTARITDPDGMGAVSLSYQLVDPGGYIRLTDSNYLTNWTSVPMVDNGTNGDAVAGDSNFTAVLPASLQTHRRLVRYRISFADSLGNPQTVPYTDDEQPNFAYFVYNGVPAWTGTIRPGAPTVTYPVSGLPNVRTYQLIADATDVNNSQYSGGYNGMRFRGTIVYDGIVYDHIEFKNRGIGSTYQAGKNKWNIFFNRTRDLVARDNWGRKYAETWNNLILNANAAPWAPVNRGAAGVEEASSARIFELAGNTNFRTHYVHWRVIDDAVETSPADQYTGDLWGLYLAIEPTEGNFLDERNLPDGNVYSIEGGGGDKKHQGEGQPVDSSDWITFRNSLAAGGQTEAWYRANMDLDKLYTFMAINRLIGNVDVRPGDNYRYYHRSSDNKWEILGYDFDMQFIPAHHWGGTMDGVTVAGQPTSILAIMRHPALAREYRNRCRELMDLLASDGAADGGQIGQLLHEYASLVNPTGQTVTWANLDAAVWNLNPRTTGGHSGNFYRANMTDSRGGLDGTVSTGSWIRTLADPDGDGFSDFPNRIKWFVDFSTNTYPAGAAPWVRKATYTAGGGNDPDVNRQKGYGYKYLEWESLYGGYANANVEPGTAPNNDYPNTPTLTATGDPGFPTSGLDFTSGAFSDPQGSGTFAAWQWRIAEISAPGIPGYDSSKPCKYEIEALATSAPLTTAPGAFSIPLGMAEAGKTYRVRVRHKDATGNWGHWSLPVQFAATAPAVQLVHYWNFNTPAPLLTPTRTSGGGAITVSGTWESGTGQDFAAANSRLGNAAGSHLRVNLPIGQTVDIKAPTTGFEDIILRYETRRSGQGAGTQTVSYTLDGTNYVPFETFAIADGVPEVKVLDFRNLPDTDNNPAFAVRVTFQQAGGGTAGNNRFDNLTVEGRELPERYANWRIASFPNPADLADDNISGPQANPSGDGVENLIRYALGVGPYDPVAGLLPELLKNGGNHDFRFRYDATKPDLIWRVKGTNDLTTWPTVLFDSQTSTIPPLENGWLGIPLPAPGGGQDEGSKLFIRLEVELATP